jgi:hypothetical protein
MRSVAACPQRALAVVKHKRIAAVSNPVADRIYRDLMNVGQLCDCADAGQIGIRHFDPVRLANLAFYAAGVKSARCFSYH